MNNIFKGLLAGWGASKLGGGCLSTILVFGLIWWALGTCDNNQHTMIPQKPDRSQTTVYSSAAVSDVKLAPAHRGNQRR